MTNSQQLSTSESTSQQSTQLGKRGLIAATITFFSLFFGAGNLIFPPMLGALAGKETPIATAGFIISAVGLPVLGVLAVSLSGGFEQLASRVHPRFATVLAFAIILCIGPGFAIPRTATTSYSMAIEPFVGAHNQLALFIFSACFFILSFITAQHPELLSRILGRFMGPILLAMIAVLTVLSIFANHPAAGTPTGDFAAHQFTKGIISGYQTLDLMAAVYFGIVISANIRSMGVTNEKSVRKYTSLAGLGTGIILSIVYVALSFIGTVSGAITPVNPLTDNGATVLTNLSSYLFGPAGTAALGVLFFIACFNVCTGLISTCSTFFNRHFPKLSYRAWSIVFALVSFAVANAGLTAIIAVSVPVLSALYPIVIVLVMLGIVHRPFTQHIPYAYAWSAALAGITSVVAVLHSLGMPMLSWVERLPLYEQDLSWLLPAVVGLLIGAIHSQVAAKRK